MDIGIFFLIGMMVLILLGVPIAFGIGIAVLGAIYLGNYQYIVMPQMVFAGMDSFPILAIPFFILAGNLMTEGGINEKILKFAESVTGRLKGSLGIITVVASAIFAAISGSGTATVAAIGSLTIPSMIKEKYSKEFAAAVASSASILGPLIPPSIIMIVYGNSVQISVTDLFMGGVIPGLLLALAFMLYTYYYAVKHNLPVGRKIPAKQMLAETKNSFWALLMPVIMLGGIFGGIVTPTEAAAVSVVYAFIVGAFLHKKLTLATLRQSLYDSALTTSIIMLLLATSKISSWVLTVAKVPTAVAASMLSITSDGVVIMILINILLLFVGMIMEANVAVVILAPILLPLAQAVGVGPLQFGIIMTVNLCLGLLTPPVGLCLFLGNKMADAELDKTIIATLPFIFVSIVVLILTTFVPSLTLWLPAVLKSY